MLVISRAYKKICILVYFAGDRVFIGDYVTPANGTILIRAKERDQWVTLPCATSVKNAQVQLFKTLASGVSKNYEMIGLDIQKLYDYVSCELNYERVSKSTYSRVN